MRMTGFIVTGLRHGPKRRCSKDLGISPTASLRQLEDCLPRNPAHVEPKLWVG